MRGEASNQQFCWWRRIIIAIVPRLMWLMIWLLALSCRKRYLLEGRDFTHNELEHIKSHIDADGGKYDSRFIAIFWHGEFLMLPFAYRYLRHKHPLAVVASRHFHGEIVARLYELFGFEAIRGSSNYGGVNRGGIRVLREALTRLDQGYDVALTPDGPKGPYHSISDGVPALSQKAKVPLVVFRPKMQFCIRMRSWDRFQIPIPFSRIDYYISAPFMVDEGLSSCECKQKIYEKMQALC